jgi:hypothetical protein
VKSDLFIADGGNYRLSQINTHLSQGLLFLILIIRIADKETYIDIAFDSLEVVGLGEDGSIESCSGSRHIEMVSDYP